MGGGARRNPRVVTDNPAAPLGGSGVAGPRQLRRLLDAVMSLGSDLELPALLRRIVEAGQELVGARYAALGVLDTERTYLAEFLTVGIDDDGRSAIGELPKGHGILGVLINTPQPLRLADLGEHPDRYGFPVNHPPMRSFLGVPLYVRGQVFGNLYFTEKIDGEVFTDIDEELAIALAAAAAIGIENARLHQRTRELGVIADRERLGRDLHDIVIQQIFATGLALHTTARMATDPAIQERIVEHINDLDEVIRQLRSVIFQLDVRRASAGGLRMQILQLIGEASRLLGFDPLVRLDGPIETLAEEPLGSTVLAVLNESLANVARHAGATAVEVCVAAGPSGITVEVSDDGVGFDIPSHFGNGMRNIEERARQLGGACTWTPADGGGTTLQWSVPLIRL